MKSLKNTAVLVLGITAASCKKQPAADKPAGIPSDPTPAAPSPSPPPIAKPSEAEMVPAAPDPKGTVEGTIFIPSNRKKALNKNAVLFITVRRAGGPPGPGAMMGAQKHPVGDFPMPFSLSSRDAMIPGTPFDGEVNISVRIDSDGDAIAFAAANSNSAGAADTLNSGWLKKHRSCRPHT